MAKYIINAFNQGPRISKDIQGHFAEHLGSCIYGGIFVGPQSEIPNTDGIRNDVLTALRALEIPNLRWPGGCFADTYHWRDGIGPVEDRPSMVNVFWGGVTEDNSFGTHEFMRLCQLLECEPYINGNLGSGTVQEMSEWVQYLTFSGDAPMTRLRAANGRTAPWKVKYFGVGNENWGCGGNLTAAEYAAEYRRYQTYLSNTPENKLYKIACGPSDDNYAWMETLLTSAGRRMDGISMHYYTLGGPSWEDQGSALGFSTDEWYQVLNRSLKMDGIITGHERIMDRHDPEGRIGLIVDEWGTWYDVEPETNPGFLYQQNTVRDALVAAVTLNIFNKHSGRVVMANLAQTVNVLQSLILTDGPRMLRTPTYHVFDLYRAHRNGVLVDTFIQTEPVGPGDTQVPDLQESASIGDDGRLTITLANLCDNESRTVEAVVLGHPSTSITGRIVGGAPGAHNTFDAPDTVTAREFTDFAITGDGFTMEVPPASVVSLTVG
ncbi:MAG: alpha-N-arabinofuranosidase [Spirochaetales bacterium]|nr:MAG: alpha-N-arabinofuranosidase [Spirochaetales bacterium]